MLVRCFLVLISLRKRAAILQQILEACIRPGAGEDLSYLVIRFREMLVRKLQDQCPAKIELSLVGNGDVFAGLIDILRQRLFIVIILAVQLTLARCQAQIGRVLHRLSEAHEIERVPNLRVLDWRLCHVAWLKAKSRGETNFIEIAHR